MSFKTIKDNYDEFYKLFDFVKEELKYFYIKEVVINNYPNLIISNCDTKDFDVIMGDNPTVLIKTNYYKNKKLKIEIEMSFLEEYEYREIIDLLYYQINDLNNELSKLNNENNNLKKVYLKIIGSKSWRIISLFRNSYNNLKNKIKKGVDNEKK